MAETSIEWTHREGTVGKTWNPTTGCDKISPGCGLPRFPGDQPGGCYALAMAKRLKGMGQAKYQNDGDPRTSGPGFGITTHADTLSDPLKWRKPTTVFVNSMSDLFHAKVPREFVARVFAVMAATPQHTYQILTKRPERMARMLADEAFVGEVRRFYDQIYSPGRDAGLDDEQFLPVEGFAGYLVSSHGYVYTAAGRTECGWCGTPVDGFARRRFCSQKCNSKAHYEKRMGRWTAPDGMRRLSPDAGEQGHLRVTLYRDGVAQRHLVHRLVLSAFGRLPVSDEQGRHLDSDPSNNHIGNLAWGTQAENWEERRKHGRHRSYSKLTQADVLTIRARAAAGESAYSIARDYPVSDTQVRNVITGEQWRSQDTEFPWPLPWVWVGTSIESDEFTKRADALRATPAAVRFISAEPLLGPLPLLDLTGINWLIAGGESGPGSRPMDLGWVRDLIGMCRASGTAPFVKQLGALQTSGPKDKKGGDWSTWPADLRVREYPAVAQAVTR